VERDISVLPTDTPGSDVLTKVIPCKVLVENNDLDADSNSAIAVGILATYVITLLMLLDYAVIKTQSYRLANMMGVVKCV
jgi:hypothetical protein